MAALGLSQAALFALCLLLLLPLGSGLQSLSKGFAAAGARGGCDAPLPNPGCGAFACGRCGQGVAASPLIRGRAACAPAPMPRHPLPP
jgi:hypothetical protein